RAIALRRYHRECTPCPAPERPVRNRRQQVPLGVGELFALVPGVDSLQVRQPLVEPGGEQVSTRMSGTARDDLAHRGDVGGKRPVIIDRAGRVPSTHMLFYLPQVVLVDRPGERIHGRQRAQQGAEQQDEARHSRLPPCSLSTTAMYMGGIHRADAVTCRRNRNSTSSSSCSARNARTDAG